MNIVYQSDNGQIIHGDNIEVMKTIKDNSIDSCVSDFPYDLSFMGRKWDTTGNFYGWCKSRAIELYRIMKPGGYVCIFGHPKTNHRMKCAFEDVGFNIVEEIDWIYLSGMPKNQDIGKMFDKHKGGSLIVDEIMKYLKKYRLKKGVSVSQLDRDVFGGTTIDITAGSCTHAVAVEELNRDEGYNLKYINIELMNTETEPYCNVGKMRVESIVKNMS